MASKTGIFLACLGLTFAIAGPAHATFPGTNGKLALVVDDNFGQYRIATVNPDGSGLTELTSFPLDIAQDPAWSADGRRIAFVAHATTEHDGLFVMDAGGGNRAQVSVRPMVPSGPAWSPDGGTIAFHQLDLWTVGAGGQSAPSHLFGDAGLNPSSSADWSPGGEQIAFVRAASNVFCDEEGECITLYTPDIWVVRHDGTDARQLTTDGSNYSPSWSPDGGRIAFVHSGRLEVMNANGTARKVLAERVNDAVWSPDGERIAFSDGTDVYVMDAAGGTPMRVLVGNNLSRRYSSLAWQPIPNHTPDCSGVGADPSELWPPNHKLRTVTLSGATDPDRDVVVLRATGATSNGPGGAAQAQGSSILLRAERNPKGATRVYTVAFRVTDEPGASCSGTVRVTVPGPKS